MLNTLDAIVTIAVKDLKRAQGFYEGILGMQPLRENEPTTISYKSGQTPIMIYQSQFAGTNRATAATWVVPNLVPIVAALKAKGVVFEHYDFPGTKREGDIHIAGRIRNAWFKDPDGNILAIVSSEH